MNCQTWCIFKLTLLALSFLGQKAEAHILIYRRTTSQLIEEYNDLPAQFGPSLPHNGLRLFLVPAQPECGCERLQSPPTPDYPSTARFVALIKRGCNCTFELKVRNAQVVNYSAVIVYNNDGDDLEQMSAENQTGIHIPSVFVGQTTGSNLKSFYSSEIVLVINDELPFNINTQLILPFSLLIGLCFLIMVLYMIYKCIREQRRLRRYRLPKSMLKKIPILRYTKNNTDLNYETCVICLEDFVENDKVRVLPCRHPYHSHCIDPWLTQNRRVCPICKRKVFTKGDTRSSRRNRQPSLDSVTDTDDDTTPLLQQPNGSSAATVIAGSAAAAAVATTSTEAGASTTRHGTFRRDNATPTTADNGSDDENVLLSHQQHPRINPFDRAPNLPPHLAEHFNDSRPTFWQRLNFGFLFRRQPVNISIAAPPYLESVETMGADGNIVASFGNSQATAVPSPPAHSSNNILNPNLSGSFKDDDGDGSVLPHFSLYEPIVTTTTPTPNGNYGQQYQQQQQQQQQLMNSTDQTNVDSVFIQAPIRGGIGVVALPNMNSSISAASANHQQTQQQQLRQFSI